MKKQKILYTLTVEDVRNISKREDISFTTKDLPLIQDKIGDYFGDSWQEAIIYALSELTIKR
jgi:hypothetical protein